MSGMAVPLWEWRSARTIPARRKVENFRPFVEPALFAVSVEGAEFNRNDPHTPLPDAPSSPLMRPKWR